MVEPGDVASECVTKRIVIVTAAQSGKTEMMLDLMGQRLDQHPSPILYVGPNKQFLTEQFEPRIMHLLDEAPTLMAKVARGKRMTKTRKTVAGVSVRLAHAGSSSALKSDPACLALVDEYDEMLANVKGQGDPLGLVERRGDTFADFVCVVTSTPRNGIAQAELDEQSGLIFWSISPSEDVRESPIWNLWQNGTRHHWCWPCPHCRDYFVPRFDLLKWPEGATADEAAENSWLVCPRCGGVIIEEHKGEMNSRGRYVAPGQRIASDGEVSGSPAHVSTISYWVSGLCSPFVSMGDRARVYLHALALGDPAMAQTAINAGFGELYAPGGRDLREWQQVARRRLPFKFGEVPQGAIKLTCAVDVQKAGLFYSIRAWGERASSWQVESGELAGFTNEREVWGLLADVINTEYGGLHISLIMIDSGFRPNKPEEGWNNSVYEFCARHRRCRATKGYDQLSAPIMRGKGKVTIPGRIGLQSTIEIVRLDTDFWKTRLQERLAWPVNQAGGFWLSQDASEDYCRQLVSEVRTLGPSGKPIWVPVTRRNHFLDVEAMNEAAGHLIGAQKFRSGAGEDDGRAEEQSGSSPPQPPSSPRPAGASVTIVGQQRKKRGIASMLAK
jgi:phage terminase large subunit GpA-like protein